MQNPIGILPCYFRKSIKNNHKMSFDATTTSSPNYLIPFNFDAGQRMWNETHMKNERMVQLTDRYSNQMLSGPGSLALLITAINAAYRLKLSNTEHNSAGHNEIIKNPPRSLHTKELTQLGVLQHYFEEIQVERNGCTLEQLGHISSIHLGFGVQKYSVYRKQVLSQMTQEKINELNKAEDHNDRLRFPSLNHFRNFILDFFKFKVNNPMGLIANYDISQLEDGDYATNNHFGLIAAYHKESDSILLVDTWRYESDWITTKHLFEAMSAIDERSQLPKGLLQIYELLY